ncbi:hypothetical protein MMC10_005690 [Thelotrema lepadinum]|nr:hypothetical protein [Thelotrema lepadinum]
MAGTQNHTGTAGENIAPRQLQAALVPMLESFVPGLSLVSGLFSSYFKIDVTQYLLSLLVLLGIVTGAKHCTQSLWSYFSEYMFSTAEIRYDDEMYNYLMFWISKQNFSRNTSQFVAGTQTNSQEVWTGEDDSDNPADIDGEDWENLEEQPVNWDKMKELYFTPAIGTHFFRYKRQFLTFERHRDENKGFISRLKTETLYLSCLGRDPQVLKDLLHEAQMTYHARDGNRTIIYRGSKPYGGGADDMDWVRCLSRPPRPLSTVVLDQGQKDMIIDDMKEYLHPYTRRWYSNRGIPYRRGYLFYGPPGTGKTSLCFAVAGLLNLRIYVVSLNSRSLTEETLANLFRELPWRCIVLLEDIDSAGITAKRVEDKAEDAPKQPETNTAAGLQGGENSTNPRGITLSGFLNIIDGVASSEGRILCMTTNHKEALDPAILRPGRVDMTVRFGYADAAMIKAIYQSIFSNQEAKSKSKSKATSNGDISQKSTTHVNGHSKSSIATLGEKTEVLGLPTPPASPTTLSSEKPQEKGKDKEKPFQYRHHSKTDEEIAEMAEKFAELMPSEEFTPAELQGYLLKHKNSPQGALEGVDEFVQTIRAEKKERNKKT